jgi:hypothetical protein
MPPCVKMVSIVVTWIQGGLPQVVARTLNLTMQKPLELLLIILKALF